MEMFSRWPLVEPKLHYLFEEGTPTAEARGELPNGRRIRFYGLHPRPPLGESQPTTLRDGSIAAMALAAMRSREPAVLAGDFNAVTWESTMRLAKDLAGLEDPRVGRGFLGSFNAKCAWMRWPLDHILHQHTFTLLSFEPLGFVGSDHFPVFAELCLRANNAPRTKDADIDAANVEAARAAVEAARELGHGGDGAGRRDDR